MNNWSPIVANTAPNSLSKFAQACSDREDFVFGEKYVHDFLQTGAIYIVSIPVIDDNLIKKLKDKNLFERIGTLFSEHLSSIRIEEFVSKNYDACKLFHHIMSRDDYSYIVMRHDAAQFLKSSNVAAVKYEPYVVAPSVKASEFLDKLNVVRLVDGTYIAPIIYAIGADAVDFTINKHGLHLRIGGITKRELRGISSTSFSVCKTTPDVLIAINSITNSVTLKSIRTMIDMSFKIVELEKRFITELFDNLERNGYDNKHSTPNS